MKPTVFDLFLSHASLDKERVAAPFVEALRREGMTVWFDVEQIEIGDSISERIEQGLLNSKYAIVLLTKNYANRKWTSNELRTIFALERPGVNRVLPVLFELSVGDIEKISPLLLDRAFVDISNGVDGACKSIRAKLRAWPSIHAQRIVESFTRDGTLAIERVKHYYSGLEKVMHSDAEMSYSPYIPVPLEFFHHTCKPEALHVHLSNRITKLRSFKIGGDKDSPHECVSCGGTAWSLFGVSDCPNYFTSVRVYFCLQCGQHFSWVVGDN